MKFIYDEGKIKNWVSRVLPSLEEDEVFLMLLVARKKDFPEIKKDFVLSRQLIREGSFEEVLRKIRRWECSEGAFTYDNKPIPQECLSIQIDPNPHSTLKAFRNFVKEYLDLIFSEKDKKRFRKIDVDLFSAIHKSYSRKTYILLDLDNKKNFDKVIKTLEPISDIIISVVETKGGYHFLLRKDSEKLKVLYKDLRDKLKDLNVEILSTFTTLIPGTIQRGFKVRDVKIL